MRRPLAALLLSAAIIAPTATLFVLTDATASVAATTVGTVATPTSTPTSTPTEAASGIGVTIPAPTSTITTTSTTGTTTTVTTTTGPAAAGHTASPPAASSPAAASVVAPSAPPIPDTPATTTNRLTLNQQTFHSGQKLIAVGKGYTPGEKVQFLLYPGPLLIGNFVADASGTVTATTVLASTTATGSHTVDGTGWQSARVVAAGFVETALTDQAATIPSWVIPGIGGVCVLLAAVLIGGFALGWFPGFTARVRTGQSA